MDVHNCVFYGEQGKQKTTFPHDNGESQIHRMTQNYIQRDHYSLGEKLELSESRSIEFKAGPGFIKYDFRGNIGKYICGFVNSNEDGILIIGVEDSGLVRGYNITHGQEDFIRCQVDEAVKDIFPDVFLKDYSLRFVPVIDHHGNHSGYDFVIEISVLGSNYAPKDRLYECKQGVFLHRDGSLEGPLKPKQIQEWTRRIFESKRNLERENNLMKDELQVKNLEQERLKAKIHQLEEKLETGQQNSSQNSDETLKELGEIKQLLSKNNKSKGCAII